LLLLLFQPLASSPVGPQLQLAHHIF
jgi:hypothetical protein